MDSMGSLVNHPNSSHVCDGCNEIVPVEKVYVGQSMCYAFSIAPADARHYRSWSTSPQIVVKIQDRTEKAMKITTNWRAYLMPDQHLTQPSFPSITVEPFSVTTLKTTAQNFITVSDEGNYCRQSNEVPVDYSADRCVVKCLHKFLKHHFKCDIFWYSANDDFKSPHHYCNYFDPVPGSHSSLNDVFSRNETSIINSDEGAVCLKNCSYKCERTIYTSTLDSKFTIIVLDEHNLTGKAKEQNMSVVVVSIDNTAISQGGILTLTEVDTFSFSTLVSNIGGTLGLFVGGTIMTFFQFIMFLINRGLDAWEKRRRVQSCRNGLSV